MHSAHFTEDDLRCHGTNCCGGENKVTQELLDALEEYRAIVGLPVWVNCAYRCQIHNAAVGGVAGSEHPSGEAADVKVPGLNVLEMYREALKVPAFANGGIGLSELQGYLHLDVRPRKARWCYGPDGKQCAWDVTIDQRAG